jgi:hypothetical protein
MNRFIGSSPVVTTNNDYTIANTHNLQLLHTNLLSLFPLVITIRFLARIYNTFTVTNSSSDLRRLSSTIQSPVWYESQLQAVVRHGTDHAENTSTVLLTACVLDCLQSCCLATNRDIRYNNELPIVVMQY